VKTKRSPMSRGLAVTLVIIALAAAGVYLYTNSLPSPALSADGTPLLSLRASGDAAVRAATVDYEITVVNWQDGLIQSAYVTHTLPSGRSYVPGTPAISIGGWPVTTTEPTVDGRNIVWGPLQLPSAGHTAHNPYGIHTLVQDFCDEGFVDLQLDHSLALAGSGGHVTQMFYSITEDTIGPEPCAVYFVNAAYDRNLIPILRLQGVWIPDGGGAWERPNPGPDGDYAGVAAAFARYVAELPRRDDLPLYVSIWNEPDIGPEWGGQAGPQQYARFFVAVADAIRDLGDSRIKILNGPVTQFVEGLEFIHGMMEVPGFAEAFDLWAVHCYAFNHPPSYNIHDGTAFYLEVTIDCYLRQQEVLVQYGRGDVDFIITEAGYDFGSEGYHWEGFPPVDRELQTAYTVSAFRDYYATWPEIIAVTPYVLGAPHAPSIWEVWEWIDYYDPQLAPVFSMGWTPHPMYDAVAAMPKPRGETVPRSLEIGFQARVAPRLIPCVGSSRVSATAGGVTATLPRTATVLVFNPRLQ